MKRTHDEMAEGSKSIVGKGLGHGRPFIQGWSDTSSSIHSGLSEGMSTLSIAPEDDKSRKNVPTVRGQIAAERSGFPLTRNFPVPSVNPFLLRLVQQMSEDSGSVKLSGASIDSEATSRSGRTMVSIPKEEFTLAFSNLRSGGATSGSYFDAPSASEKTVECPYDSNHRMPETSMRKHLEKCRQNYILQMQTREDVVGKRACMYNFKHQELPPEISYHEKTCKDRDRPPYYLFFLNPWLADEEEVRAKFSLEEIEEFCEFELTKMREGLHLNEFVGGANLDFTPLPFEDIRQPGSRSRRIIGQEGRARNRAKTLEQVAKNLEKEGKIGSETTEVVDQEMDEEEKYWNVPNKSGFDYLDSWYNSPRLFLWKYPPGLTKAQRREYDKYSTEYMSRILEADKSNEVEASTTEDTVTMATPVSTTAEGSLASTNRSRPTTVVGATDGDFVATPRSSDVASTWEHPRRAWKASRRFVTASFRSETTTSGRSEASYITDYSGVADEEDGASGDE